MSVPPESSTKQTTKLELGREYPQPDEDKIIAQMVEITIGQMKAVDGCPYRAQHAKATGCVMATFRVADDVPIELQHGVFREPGRSFDCLIRFSNSQGTVERDGVGTARGMAIKLLNVDGQWAMDGTENRTQDFVFFDHPAFPFPTPQHYLDTMRRKSIPLIGDLVAGTHLALFERDELKILKALRGKKVASPLEIKYWSVSPFWLGSTDGKVGQAVKYAVVPRETSTEPPENPEAMPEDYLRKALENHLAKQEAVYDFHVQVQTDADAMPIEDVSLPWNEDVSRPIPVATIHIAEQNVSIGSDVERRCESLSFNPWHALAEHRPLGGMNRLRRAVYAAGFSHRVERST